MNHISTLKIFLMLILIIPFCVNEKLGIFEHWYVSCCGDSWGWKNYIFQDGKCFPRYTIGPGYGIYMYYRYSITNDSSILLESCKNDNCTDCEKEAFQNDKCYPYEKSPGSFHRFRTLPLRKPDDRDHLINHYLEDSKCSDPAKMTYQELKKYEGCRLAWPAVWSSFKVLCDDEQKNVDNISWEFSKECKGMLHHTTHLSQKCEKDDAEVEQRMDVYMAKRCQLDPH